MAFKYGWDGESCIGDGFGDQFEKIQKNDNTVVVDEILNELSQENSDNTDKNFDDTNVSNQILDELKNLNKQLGDLSKQFKIFNDSFKESSPLKQVSKKMRNLEPLKKSISNLQNCELCNYVMKITYEQKILYEEKGWDVPKICKVCKIKTNNN